MLIARFGVYDAGAGKNATNVVPDDGCRDGLKGVLDQVWKEDSGEREEDGRVKELGGGLEREGDDDDGTATSIVWLVINVLMIYIVPIIPIVTAMIRFHVHWRRVAAEIDSMRPDEPMRKDEPDTSKRRVTL